MRNALLGVLLVALIGGAFAVTLFGVRLMNVWFPQQVCGTLIYQVDPKFVSGGDARAMRQLLAGVNARVEGRADAILRGSDEIEVRVFGDDPDVLQRIRRLVENPGSLEFRILANRQTDKELVSQAMEQQGDRVVGKDGKLLARWAPLRSPEAIRQDENRYYAADPEQVAAVTRTSRQGDQQITQVLVVQDDVDVNENDVASAARDVDVYGGKCVALRLTGEGQRRLAALTGKNVSNPMQGSMQRLGVILNGQVSNASVIDAPLQQAQINGIPDEEIDDLVTVLEAGALPARIEFSRRVLPEGQR